VLPCARKVGANADAASYRAAAALPSAGKDAAADRAAVVLPSAEKVGTDAAAISYMSAVVRTLELEGSAGEVDVSGYGAAGDDDASDLLVVSGVGDLLDAPSGVGAGAPSGVGAGAPSGAGAGAPSGVGAGASSGAGADAPGGKPPSSPPVVDGGIEKRGSDGASSAAFHDGNVGDSGASARTGGNGTSARTSGNGTSARTGGNGASARTGGRSKKDWTWNHRQRKLERVSQP
jgi:hypothetical protein